MLVLCCRVVVLLPGRPVVEVELDVVSLTSVPWSATGEVVDWVSTSSTVDWAEVVTNWLDVVVGSLL